ncbi:MAG: hypothetical protein LQ350_006958 [Teloschistes chrysophthalmus]|nr:MAG: hypothetical protein LQ350_006958 [Niorma chrysophthalma]
MLLLLALLLSLAASCLAVNATFRSWVTAAHVNREILYDLQTCTNLRPGHCCRHHLPGFQGPSSGIYRFDAGFTALRHLDIAAIWKGGSGGCTGIPIATQPGPGVFGRQFISLGWGVRPEDYYAGMSYIRLSSDPPRDMDVPWMEAEGILGFVAGGKRWVSPKAGPSVWDQVYSFLDSISVGARKGKRRIVGRGISGAEKGQVFVQPPSKTRWVWPDVVEVNGTSYREETPGSPLYRSDDERTLDFGAPR